MKGRITEIIKWTLMGDNYSSGIYFYSLQVDGKIIQTNRMLIIK